MILREPVHLLPVQIFGLGAEKALHSIRMANGSKEIRLSAILHRNRREEIRYLL
jgi:hypothetical protein